MAMECISTKKAKEIAAKAGIKPGIVKGTKDGVQFVKGNNPRIDPITWEKFEQCLDKRDLAIYESGGWMKIMKKK